MRFALLIDLDDTLLDDRGAMARSVLQFREKHHFAQTVTAESLVARWESVGRDLMQKLSLGLISFQDQRRVRLRQVFLTNLSDQDADALFDDFLWFYEANWTINPGVKQFLNATAHIPRGIITNAHRSQAERKLEWCGLVNNFAALVTPDDCGARKPDYRIFAHALNLLGVGAGEAMMIGDSLEFDINPALALGMKAFHVNILEAGCSILDASAAVHLQQVYRP
jgi:putative hydrolase of the HAD superfamily